MKRILVVLIVVVVLLSCSFVHGTDYMSSPGRGSDHTGITIYMESYPQPDSMSFGQTPKLPSTPSSPSPPKELNALKQDYIKPKIRNAINNVNMACCAFFIMPASYWVAGGNDILQGLFFLITNVLGVLVGIWRFFKTRLEINTAKQELQNVGVYTMPHIPNLKEIENKTALRFFLVFVLTHAIPLDFIYTLIFGPIGVPLPSCMGVEGKDFLDWSFNIGEIAESVAPVVRNAHR